MRKIITTTILTALASSSLFAQNVGIGTATPSSSAKLEISSSNSGLLIPRVALTITTASAPVAAPATSLLVYNTATAADVTPGYYYWTGTAWTRLLNTTSADWTLTGNAGTVPGTNFIGTTDAVDFVTRTSNTERMRVKSSGNVGVGTTLPIQLLDVNGRMNVTNGVIQRGTTQINATSDLGLYSQVVGNWIRFASNAAPIKFFTDQGGANGAGTNATVSIDNANGGGVMIAAETSGTGNAGVPNSRAALEISSTTKGMLTPRLTTAQRDAMGNSLTEGLLIYNLSNDCFEYWDTKATPNGANGFWNSLCKNCSNVIVISTNQVGFNLNTYVGGGKMENYCVYINAGVTLQAAGNGGANSAAGNPAFNSSTMPAGARITLYNYGTILAGGGNGGRGGVDCDGVCAGTDAAGGVGGAGGHAILTSSSVPVQCFNYGVIRSGGGGGGGGGYGCCAAGGGGGGGAGTPAGSGGGNNTTNCTSGFVCGCGGSTSVAGNAGAALTGGTGGAGVNRGATACTCDGIGAGTGGTGGVNGVGGNGGTSGNAGGGGVSGLALQGNGSGSSISNNGGTTTGAVNP